MNSAILRMAATAIALAIAGCGGGSPQGGFAASYTIGGTVSGLATGASVTLVNNGTDTLTVNSNTAFVFATSIPQNGSYAVTVKTQPTGQSCAVSGGSGSMLMANVTGVAVVCASQAQYAYVVNNGNNTVSQFSINASGMLAPLTAATVATGNSPRAVTVDPTRRYVYVPNLLDNTVSQYVIQPDGTLAPNTPATVAHRAWTLGGCRQSVGHLGVCGQQRRQHYFTVQRQCLRRAGGVVGCTGAHRLGAVERHPEPRRQVRVRVRSRD